MVPLIVLLAGVNSFSFIHYVPAPNENSGVAVIQKLSKVQQREVWMST